MNGSSKTAAAALTAAGVLVGAWLPAGTSAAAGGPGQPRVLWGEVTIPPGRDGIVEAGGLTGTPPGTGSTLTLTAPAGTRVTAVPLDAPGYRGAVAADGRTAVYTAVSERQPWREGAFPFVLAVPSDAEPGTRLSGCVLRLADPGGLVEASGGCQVTVGLAEPVLARPESGVPLEERPAIAGRAHPGAQITVSDQDGDEVCADTTGSDGLWACTPARALPGGPNRLQATATLNGVSASSEQIQITVTARR
ncbi:carboxypeptidase regulatory-like domain-containing protein [Streptomyces sp. CHD11]|uniref:carboxypeptidase regulatory-like domain-containing protein n=1 Tax=Streptomyces sp. CHD11 TaxID=2741325 RepID=UPI001BFC29B2|nr:carboxypeptidase regulatory-like domain-containing protein [Streptomyces sp. CHD11]MBT3152671.1 carboxypeptidase regulatory-like domain-containing protein [Streptomyces sp. CHD11]